MTTPGLTDEGFVALRTADYLDRIRASYEASVKLSFDWGRERFLGNITVIMAQLLGELGEASQALYDAFDVNNATGVMLENLCALVGVERREATFSTVELTLTGDEGTLIPVGYVVEGGGEDGNARWETTDDAYIGQSGSTTVVARAFIAGPFEAAPGEIETIVMPVDGWDEVTNSASASAGQAREEDDTLRQRRQASLQIPGSTSANAIRAELLSLDVLLAVAILENDSSALLTTAGVTISPHAVRPVLWTGDASPALTDAQVEAIALTLHEHVSAGVRVDGADVEVTIEGEGLIDRVVRWDWADVVEVDVSIILSLADGYELADVEGAVESALDEYFGALSVGGAVRLLALYALLYTIEGVEGASITLDGVSADVEASLVEVPQPGTTSITAA